MLAAGQCRQMGRAVSICPDALLDDGLLDFTIMMGRLGERVSGAVGAGLKAAAVAAHARAAPFKHRVHISPIRTHRQRTR